MVLHRAADVNAGTPAEVGGSPHEGTAWTPEALWALL